MAKTRPKISRANAIIGQSGGPTVVINESLVGAVLEARRHEDKIEQFYGACHGVRGIINREFIDLTRESHRRLEAVARTPAAGLGSVRHKPNDKECARMLQVMQEMQVHYFFYIGGNDSAETALILDRMARKTGFPLQVLHIPKTIDNDLRVTDHCPGYGSAARFVAQVFMGDDLDNRSLPGVKINMVMGREAGFLTASSVLGRTRHDSGPHLVYVPERTFYEDKFIKDVKRMLKKHGRCLIAISEGIKDSGGEPFSKRVVGNVLDVFGNPQHSGSGALGDMLSAMLRSNIDPKMRIRADTLGYAQRSFPGMRSEVDAAEARKVGEVAVQMAAKGLGSGSIVILRNKSREYSVKYVHAPLEKVAHVTKSLPASYINRAGNGITQHFIDYALPLVGKLPFIEYLDS